MKSLAPVLVMVYDRLDSLKNAITSLKTNELAKHTHLYVVSDAPYKDEHKEIIAKVREYINSISGFEKVEGIFWESNKGSFQSGKDATSYIFGKYDKIIALEDDIVVSNRFLEYMNNALDCYEDDKRIFSITSHLHYKKNIIPKNYPHDVFLLKMFNPWGNAFWKDRYEAIDWNLEGLESFLQDKKQVYQINQISTHLLPLLQDVCYQHKKYTDVMFCYNMFKKNQYTLYPTKALSVNRGHDGRGEHCGVDEKWQNQPLTLDFCPKMLKDIPYSPIIARNVRSAFYSYKDDFITPILKKLRVHKYLKSIYQNLKGKTYE